MEINIPAVQAEITTAFHAYTQALVGGDMDAAVAAFWSSELVLRYGVGENLYGIHAIRRLRSAQRGRHLALDIERLVVTSFGTDFGTANCEMRRSDLPGIGRMSHAWVRLPEGWRIVAAHVSQLATA